jgi:hypothetical protein
LAKSRRISISASQSFGQPRPLQVKQRESDKTQPKGACNFELFFGFAFFVVSCGRFPFAAFLRRQADAKKACSCQAQRYNAIASQFECMPGSVRRAKVRRATRKNRK